MKLNKLEGIHFFKKNHLPTVELLDISKLVNGEIPLEKGISVRLSPKLYSNIDNEHLPSIHHCQDLKQIQDFVAKYQGRYNILAHETVDPEVVGTISKVNLGDTTNLIIETSKTMEDRKHQIIDNRMTIPIMGSTFLFSKMEIQKETPEAKNNFFRVVQYVRSSCFDDYNTASGTGYNIEYVIQNENVIFTELTLADSYPSRQISEKEDYWHSYQKYDSR